jgi:protein SCO1/2
MDCNCQMNKVQKTLTITLWALCVVAAVCVVASGMWGRHGNSELPGEQAQGLPITFVPNFSLLDQNGKTITDADLKGRVWVANFVFTRCQGPCPMMTAKMAGLQDALGPANIRLVTFTVDPEHDTPQVLKAYAKERGVDERFWTLATGNLEVILSVARGMLIAAAPAEGDQPILHSTKFILVDQEGRLHGFYSSEQAGDTDRLTADALKLAGGKGGKS